MKTITNEELAKKLKKIQDLVDTCKDTLDVTKMPAWYIDHYFTEELKNILEDGSIEKA